MKLIEKLKIMQGNSFYYKDSVITIKDYQIAPDQLVLITESGNIRMPIEEGKEWVQKVDITSLTVPVKVNGTNGHSNGAVVSMQINNSVLHDCKEILMESIRKVKANREYIPQSDEINKNVKSIIELAKTEIEMVKILKS